MPRTIGIVMDPIQSIAPQKDSTLAMMLAAQDMGAALYYMEPDDLYVQNGTAFSTVRPVEVFDNLETWFRLGEKERRPLGSLNVILMRKDPPVDKRFIHACYTLEQAQRDGAMVVNDPASLIAYNEKLFAGLFPELCPPTLVSSDKNVLRDFLDQHGKIIVKPLDSMGGDGVFLVEKDDVNFDVIWEMQTQSGTYPAMAQRFIPEISEGDKRVIMIDGKAFGHALVRMPKTGSIRGNMAAGGNYHVAPLTAREKEIAKAIGPTLVKKGIVFAGIDIICGHLIEINITSPTGLRQITKDCGEDVADLVMRTILKKV